MRRHPTSEQLIAWLGYSPSDPAFSTFMDAQRIFTRPHHAFEDEAFEEDPDEARENAEESLIDPVERHSICLIYEESEPFRALFGEPHRDGAFILKEVAFYGPGVQDFPGYTERLPGGLTFETSREGVHALLGTPWASRTIHSLLSDLYLFADLVLNIAYLPDEQQIAIVHVRLPHRYDQLCRGIEPPPPASKPVDLLALDGCLGLSADSPQLIATMTPLGWAPVRPLSRLPSEETDFLRRAGLILYFEKVKDHPRLQERGLSRSGTVLAGYRFNRAGDQLSDGYFGPLPAGLAFHFTPEQAIECLGRMPDEHLQYDDTATLIWHSPDRSLHLLFSWIDYQLYRVTVLADFMILERPQPSN